MHKPLTFDEVFKIWIDAEVGRVEGTDILPVAKAKGFDSIVEWRLASALRLGLDKREWTLETLEHPNDTLPYVIIGPTRAGPCILRINSVQVLQMHCEFPRSLTGLQTTNGSGTLPPISPPPTRLFCSASQTARLAGGHGRL